MCWAGPQVVVHGRILRLHGFSGTKHCDPLDTCCERGTDHTLILEEASKLGLGSSMTSPRPPS